MSDVEMVTVQIMPGEDGEAVWVELCDAPEPGMWLASLPAAELDEFHAAHEAMGRVLAAAVEVSPRFTDGEWRRPCDSFTEGVALPAEHYWQIRSGRSHSLWEKFDTQQATEDALSRIQAGNGFLLSHGRMGGEELFSVVDTADWFVHEVDQPGGPVWGDGVCETCRFDKAEHEVKA